jgi:hypothetical protein
MKAFQKVRVLSSFLDKAGWVTLGQRADGQLFYGRAGSKSQSSKVMRHHARTGRKAKYNE